MPEYPVQTSKVQAPPLRDETLARDRLLDWLSAKIHRRAVLLVAEAGYGKTTLLADFTRRTRLRVLWFRLDRGDRDWVGFIAHLVAAFRIHMPEFGPSTRALIAETATTAPSLDTVLETFLRELAALPAEPTVFVFDDFHLVDDSVDVRHIARELLARAPERMAFVFASRREPPIRLARLRAMGEVAELGTDDLRFDATETERLFRETYEMRLEPSLVAELGRRTEGWAASLQLVRAALHDRNPGEVRAFISSLSGAEGHLYEYLAEEVIGELPDDLQQFLMRTSVLETVDLTLGPVAASVTVEEATRLIEEGERHGLFGKSGSRARHVVRAHPLVRSFLQARLRLRAPSGAVADIHRSVATAARENDWSVAATHFIAAGCEAEAEEVMTGAIEQILGSGAYAAAEELSLALTGGLKGHAGLVLRSRIAQQKAARDEGLVLAEEAWAAAPKSPVGLLNLVSARHLAGDIEGAVSAGRLLEGSGGSYISRIGGVFRRVLETSLTGDLKEVATDLVGLVDSRRHGADRHFAGVGLLNLAYVALPMGQPEQALQAADEAIGLLGSSSTGVDLVAARLARGAALAYLGRMDEARAEFAASEAAAAPGQYPELAHEVAQTEALLGESDRAWRMVRNVEPELDPARDIGEQTLYVRALLNIRDHSLALAEADAQLLRHGALRSTPGFEAQRHLALGLVRTLLGSPLAIDDIRAGTRIARDQSATLWADYGALLGSLADTCTDPSPALLLALERRPVVVSMLAEPVVNRLHDVRPDARREVLAEAERRPWRWRGAARDRLLWRNVAERERAAELLEVVGDASDVRLLSEVGRKERRSELTRHGRMLARRLANRVFVEDLGRVRLNVGDRAIDSSEVRRRVLALLCLLLTRPKYSSTREEVIDSLWPDHDPASALNSLNQTAYFLRRVFEPDYHEDTSPGYLGQDAETIWLDPELVECRSRRCLDIIRSMPGDPTPDGAVALAREYQGRYALDFAYDDWSTDYRDALHAAYLRVMEQAIRMDVNSGQVARGTFLAERALDVDRESEEIQIALIRLYRLSGAHAAAGEKYAQYARSVRELGVEPIPLNDL